MTEQTAVVAIVGIVAIVIFGFAALRGGRVRAKKDGERFEIDATYRDEECEET